MHFTDNHNTSNPLQPFEITLNLPARLGKTTNFCLYVFKRRTLVWNPSRERFLLRWSTEIPMVGASFLGIPAAWHMKNLSNITNHQKMETHYWLHQTSFYAVVSKIELETFHKYRGIQLISFLSKLLMTASTTFNLQKDKLTTNDKINFWCSSVKMIKYKT